MVAIPAPFVARIHEQLGAEEAEALLAALEGDSPTAVRFNPYKVASPPEESSEVSKIGWSRYGYYLASRPAFTFDSAFHAGCYYVQEASSQLVGHILSSASEDLTGAKILDTCAAPGGKSTLYSTIVGLEGLVVAGEANRSRAAVLADNVRRWGLGNIAVVAGDAEAVSQFEGVYDVVAVDAPCSGEGMFRKADVAREEWNEGSPKMCAERQGEILRDAWRALKAGGILIYSTCTFNSEENEGVIADFEEWCEGEVARFDDVAIDDAWGVVKGEQGMFQTFRCMPHRCKGEGFFAAVARKSFDASSKTRLPRSRRTIFQPLSRADVGECMKWVESGERMSFYAVADTIYGYYNSTFDLVRRLSESLAVIYSGVAMGQIFKGRLVPDAALGLFVGLNREAVSVAKIEADDVVVDYLRRKDVGAQYFAEGLNLVVDADDNALGFVKRIGQRVNNKYSNSLRILK